MERYASAMSSVLRAEVIKSRETAACMPSISYLS